MIPAAQNGSHLLRPWFDEELPKWVKLLTEIRTCSLFVKQTTDVLVLLLSLHDVADTI
jgi:hypothetical protein